MKVQKLSSISSKKIFQKFIDEYTRVHSWYVTEHQISVIIALILIWLRIQD